MAIKILSKLLAFPCLAALAPQEAFAQQIADVPDPASHATDRGITDIIVTARRRTENLQDIPVAITAVTGDTLRKQGVVRTLDLNNTIPNLQVTSNYGNQQPNFTLRGVGVANEFNSNAASPIGIYVDEVYQSFRSSHGQQIFDLDRIEVVRGPQGTLYGRNTTGGAINFITRQPALKDTSGYLTVGLGNLEQRNVIVAAEQTLVPDVLGIRIAGTYDHMGPWIDNLVGRDGGGGTSYAVRGTLRFRASPDVDLSLKGYAARFKGVKTPLQSFGRTLSNPGVIDYGPVGVSFGLAPYNRSGLDTRTAESPDLAFATTHAKGVVLRGRFAVADRLAITIISGYDTADFLNGYEPDSRFVNDQSLSANATDCEGTPLNICRVVYDSASTSFNQEVRLNYDVGSFKFVGGLYYGWDRIRVHNASSLYGFLSDRRAAAGLPDTYFNPLGFGIIPRGLPTPINADMRYIQTRKSKAVFGEGVYDFTPKLSATLGLRYTEDTIEYANGLSFLKDDTGTPRLVTVSSSQQRILLPAAFSPLDTEGGSNALTGRLILSYRTTDKILIYGSFGRGYRAGTYNGFAFQSTAQVNFVQPEKVNAYEVGIKSRLFDNRVQVNTTAFFYDYKGQQASQIAGQGFTSLANLDGTSKGAELEIIYQAIPALRFTMAAAVLDTRYDDGQVLSGIQVGGNKFPLAPRITFSGAVDWNIAHIGGGDLSFRGDTTYTGKFEFDPFNDRQARGILSLGGGKYWLFNGRLTYQLRDVSLAIWAKNITDKAYFQFGQNTESSWGTDNFQRNVPRTFGVESSFRF